ncbi:hypothetical protein M422DRAFT_243831 [Sphaerobolus stellatus SS14]|nr:hypothetical protein M422DRAFT_243831 [Sphaerobolus stellatus SS14]
MDVPPPSGIPPPPTHTMYAHSQTPFYGTPSRESREKLTLPPLHRMYQSDGSEASYHYPSAPYPFSSSPPPHSAMPSNAPAYMKAAPQSDEESEELLLILLCDGQKKDSEEEKR